MVALRIKQLSSGVCKTVSVERPRGKLIDFDLVVSFPPYRSLDFSTCSTWRCRRSDSIGR